jgi:hypothetical protein
METTHNSQVSSASVNYDDTPIVQVEVEGIDYRVDTGLGSAVAVSQRAEGTWAWTPVTEGRWDGRRLKAKDLDGTVVTLLSEALGRAMKDREET